jgi:hypothetical protein
LQSRADHLCRVDHTLLDQVAKLPGLGVIAERIVTRIEDLASYHGAVLARILRNLTGGRLQRAPHDIDADPLVVVGGLEATIPGPGLLPLLVVG